MTSVAVKADHVRRATNTDSRHHCHWPGCDKAVKPAVWGCRVHWYRLPQALRNKIWATYRVGQEESKTPSRDYVRVAREVQEWINARHVLPKASGLALGELVDQQGTDDLRPALLSIQERYADDVVAAPVTAIRAALAAHLADQGIKLVHIWRNGKLFNAMMETDAKHITGAGDDEISACLRGLDLMGFGGFRCRLFLLDYIVGLAVKECGR